MQPYFYATADDLLPVFEGVEARHPLAYLLCSLFRSPNRRSFAAGASLPALRKSPSHPSAMACPQYLVLPADQPVSLRDAPQHTGEIRYAVDQSANPDSITIQLGGLFAPKVLLAGRVATVSTTARAAQLHRAFASAIAKYFQRIKAFYVGPHAHQLWRGGCRLTQSAESQGGNDLAI